MTIHGKGDSRRNFIHVYDVCLAVETILLKGKINEIYNIGTNNEYTVLEIAEKLLNILKPEEKLSDWIINVEDRPFNDFRYAINSEKLRNLGWTETKDFNLSFYQYVKSIS
jgi:dTDP-D-glucose 4,6-dehydratase